ncbi:MAG TPA: Crp/Fnr family transcriptional regulator [Gemmatimonadota bacterium]|nr:Crp/Fnr family transcriptional regulator [Gemmatimonadota bacterium]
MSRFPSERKGQTMAVSPQMLSDCRTLSDLSPATLEAISEYARQAEFRQGERLIPLGQPPQRLLILTEGLAKLVGVSISGHERILSIYRPHDMVGPGVLMDSLENEHEVTAMSRVKAVAISRRDLLIIGRTHPSLIMALAKEVSRQLVAMTERVMTATSAEVPVRLSQLLLEFADGNGADEVFVPLAHPLTHESMAQIIGASRPHTSTVLRDLEGFGAVQRRSGRGLLVRPSRLRQIVGDGDFSVAREQLPLSA